MRGGQIINVHSRHALDTTDEVGVVQEVADQSKVSQRWNITPVERDVYRIEHPQSGKCLIARDDNWSVVLGKDEDRPAQRWKLVAHAGGGSYLIENLATNRVLDMPGWSTEPGTAVVQYESGGAVNQQWLLTTLTDQAPEVATGPLWAWGQNGQGQLGNGQRVHSLTPVQVQGLTRVRQLAVGVYHSMALLEGGTVRTWGNNGSGELGDGTSAGATRCLPTGGPLLTGVQAIAPGQHHALALLEDRTLRAWGWNAYGQLGDRTKINQTMPVKVSDLTGVKAIAAGTYHSIALLEDGRVRAWGHNGQGQLGNNTTADRLDPVPVLDHNNEALAGVQKISAGERYNLALREDGSVWAWGQGNWGQLGNGKNVDRACAVPVLDREGKRLDGVKDISAGPFHALALLQDDRKVLAWGHNEEGQLGNLTVTANHSTAPVAVIDDGKPLAGVTALCAAGLAEYEYSVALKDGELLTWGKNNALQLGNAAGGGADPKPVVDKNGERLRGIMMIALDRASIHYLVACG
jgi:alpha-tubulin suppressor-like RCC1 family protein